MTIKGKLIASGLALALLGSLAGCAPDNSSGEGTQLTIGSHGTLEGEILAQVYGQALEADGFTIDYNFGVGSYQTSVAGLRSGLIDVIPDYSGNLLKSIAPHTSTLIPAIVESELPKALAPLGLAVLDYSRAETTRAFVTTPQFVEAHGLTSIGDVGLFSSALTFGGPEGFADSAFGRSGLANKYGVEDWTAREKKSDAAILSDLLAGKTQVAVLSLANAGISANGLVVLEDPQYLMAPNEVVPVIAARKYSPALAQIADSVSLALTTDELAKLNSLATESADGSGQKQSVETIAHDWLESKGLLTLASS